MADPQPNRRGGLSEWAAPLFRCLPPLCSPPHRRFDTRPKVKPDDGTADRHQYVRHRLLGERQVDDCPDAGQGHEPCTRCPSLIKSLQFIVFLLYVSAETKATMPPSAAMVPAIQPNTRQRVNRMP